MCHAVSQSKPHLSLTKFCARGRFAKPANQYLLSTSCMPDTQLATGTQHRKKTDQTLGSWGWGVLRAQADKTDRWERRPSRPELDKEKCTGAVQAQNGNSINISGGQRALRPPTGSQLSGMNYEVL